MRSLGRVTALFLAMAGVSPGYAQDAPQSTEAVTSKNPRLSWTMWWSAGCRSNNSFSGSPAKPRALCRVEGWRDGRGRFA